MLLNATYGNIEMMRLMFLINEIVPQLGDVKLGNVSIVGGLGTNPVSRTNPIQLILPHFSKIIRVLNDEDSSLGIVNNFSQIK